MKIDEKEPLKEPKDKYISSMTQQDHDDEEDEDEEPGFSSDSIKKYELKFSYKDFSIDISVPTYHKPLLDKTQTADIIFDTIFNRSITLFLITIDEDFREKYKSLILKAMEVK